MAWRKRAPGEVINRYPVCAAWHYMVAKALGYSEDEAKTFGIARATFFAAAKQGFKGAGGSKAHTKPAGYKPKGNVFEKKETKTAEPDTVSFCGLNMTIDPETGYAIFGGEAVKPAQFDDKVAGAFIRKVGAGGYNHLLNEMQDLIKQYDLQALNSNYAFQLYTGIRDEFRMKDFYEKANA